MRPLHGPICKSRCLRARGWLPALLVLGVASSTFAQSAAPGAPPIRPYAISTTYASPGPQLAPPQSSAAQLPAPQLAVPQSAVPQLPAPQPAGMSYGPPVQPCPTFGGMSWNPPAGSFFGGADYLLLRTHFSEGIAYVQVTDSLVNGLPNQSVQAREINFPYSSGFRTYFGYNFTPTSGVQFTYFHFANSASISATPASPNQSFVDAYNDQTKFGQSILSNSSIQVNAFDLDYLGRFTVAGGRLNLRPAAGARWADVRQHNDTTVTDPTLGAIGVGTFNTHFTGFGPHVSLLAQARSRPQSPFSLIARGGGSLLLGGYSNTSGAVFTGFASGNQTAHRWLTVPVLEAELGGAWQPTPNLMFSAGWLWQAWFDLGVAGGTTYGGKFAETDSASIMAFDGLFLRGLWQY